MYVSSSEFRANSKKYLDLSVIENIYIMKHGKPICKLIAIDDEERVKMAESLVGCISPDLDVEKTLEGRLKDYEDLV
jgi:antitoxin (DNA-binding transcriptional repressor) of toxin-antitoxin stability system